MDEPISIQAQFVKASTTTDGGWRITFDVGHQDSHKVTDIAALSNELLQVVIMTTNFVDNQTKKKSKGVV